MKHYINEAAKKPKKQADTDSDATLGGHVDQILDNATKSLDGPVVEEDPDEMFAVLDESLRESRKILRNALKFYKRNGKWPTNLDFPNVLFVGEAGSGKTARVKAWAQSRGINLVSKQASTMDELDVGGGPARDEANKKWDKYPASEFDELDRDIDELEDNPPDSVLFLDELNRASGKVRGTLLSLIKDHVIPYGKNMKFLYNMLFTVAAINPGDAVLGYDVNDLNPAELSRFGIYDVASDPKVTKRYLDKTYDEEYEFAETDEEKLEALRKKTLADTILSHKSFAFDNAEDVAELAQMGRAALNARTFTSLLNISGGDKTKFINKWPHYCNPNKWNDIKAILANYVDPNLDDFEEVDDKATRVLKQKKSTEPSPEERGSTFRKSITKDELLAGAKRLADKSRGK